MRRIHIVGRRNHGKTALIVDLLGEFRRRGIQVGSIKHSAHRHELDPPGKDSYRHREAGANPAGIISCNLMAVFVPRSPSDDCYARLDPMFAEVAASFSQIAGLVSTTTEAAREIELSTKQQSTAVEQVNLAIASVAQATRESEASSGQTLQTASQLAEMSRGLARLVQKEAA